MQQQYLYSAITIPILCKLYKTYTVRQQYSRKGFHFLPFLSTVRNPCATPDSSFTFTEYIAKISRSYFQLCVSGLFAFLFHIRPLPQVSMLSSAPDKAIAILSQLASIRWIYPLYSLYLMLLIDSWSPAFFDSNISTFIAEQLYWFLLYLSPIAYNSEFSF